MARRIQIRVARNGKLKIDAQGFKGNGCQAATKCLETLGKTVDQELKPDFYEHEDEHELLAE